MAGHDEHRVRPWPEGGFSWAPQRCHLHNAGVHVLGTDRAFAAHANQLGGFGEAGQAQRQREPSSRDARNGTHGGDPFAFEPGPGWHPGMAHDTYALHCALHGHGGASTHHAHRFPSASHAGHDAGGSSPAPATVRAPEPFYDLEDPLMLQLLQSPDASEADCSGLARGASPPAVQRSTPKQQHQQQQARRQSGGAPQPPPSRGEVDLSYSMRQGSLRSSEALRDSSQFIALDSLCSQAPHVPHCNGSTPMPLPAYAPHAQHAVTYSPGSSLRNQSAAAQQQNMVDWCMSASAPHMLGVGAQRSSPGAGVVPIAHPAAQPECRHSDLEHMLASINGGTHVLPRAPAHADVAMNGCDAGPGGT
jgi:hypothetical protein